MITSKTIRVVAGHSRLFWFLPVFSLVLGLVVAAESRLPSPNRWVVGFWGIVAAVFLLVSVVVAVFRAADRAYLGGLGQRVSEPPLAENPTLRRYEVEVGLVLVRATFFTPFRPLDDSRGRTDLLIACLLTAVLGWWSLLGLLRAPAALVRNLKGGEQTPAADLLAALETASG